MSSLLASRGLQLALILGVLAAVIGPFLVRRPRRAGAVLAGGIGAYAAAQVGLALFGSFQRVTFPAYLGIMEGTMLTHLERLMAGQPLYPAPTPAFVPIAYVPGLYLAAWPFAAVLGPTLVALRLPAALSWLGLGVLAGMYLRGRTGDWRAALLGAGLFFSALGALENRLDSAMADALFLLLALAGAMVADRKGRGAPMLATVLWVLSFWAKQHGAILGLGGMLYLTWRQGARRTVLPWAVFLLGVPVAYLGLGASSVFGPQFFEFTYFVPASWTVLDAATGIRLAGFVVRVVPVLTLLTLAYLAGRLPAPTPGQAAAGHRPPWSRIPRWIDAVGFVYPFAVGTAILGCLDPGSTDNVLAGLVLWTILLGTAGLAALWRDPAEAPRGWVVAAVGVAVSAGLLAYPPGDALPRAGAGAALEDLESVVRDLDAAVYWPMDGRPLVLRERAPMEAQWVAIEDMVRGGYLEERGRSADELLAPLTSAGRGDVYILSRWPLEKDSLLSGLVDHYEPVGDFGARFAALSSLPDRYGASHPRFLYRSRTTGSGAGGSGR